MIKEGAEASTAVAEASRRTISRRDLERHDGFEDVSPEVGVVDDDAFAELFNENPEGALAMLADMVGASDPKLRQLSSRLAGRMMCEVATVGTTSSRGVGRIEALPFGTADGEIDLDASSEGLVELRAFRAMDPSKWKVRGWGRPSTAMCLLIDRSGSMTGERLAEAAIVAAAVSESVTNQRSFSPDDLSIAAFAREVIVIASADRPRHADGVVEDLLRMRGHGVTDLDAALQAAQRLLARSSATRKVTLLMSDCRSTTGPSPYASAAMLDELCVLCPSEDTADAEALAAQVGAAWTPLAGVLDGPAAIQRLLAHEN